MAAQFYGEARIVSKLSPAVFWPRPKVHSALVRIQPHKVPARSRSARARPFFRVVKAGFSMKRKQLKNALSGGLGVKARRASAWLRCAGIDPQRRAETLTLEEWARLASAIAEADGVL